MPRQPIPTTVEPLPKPNRIISPSLSSASAADEEDERYNRNRTALSPSPEVDLSAPELDDESMQEPPTPGAPFSGRNSVARERSESSASNLARNRRAASPQLENEERDFKQCASQLYEQAQQQRRNSQQSQDTKMEGTAEDTAPGAERSEVENNVSTSIEESEESAALTNSEVATALFGGADYLKPLESQHLELFSSPLMQPKQFENSMNSVEDKLDALPMENMSLDINAASHAKDTSVFHDWEDGLRSPEKVDLDELEDLFDAY